MDYKIDVYPPGAVRPDAFKSTYVVRNPKTGEIVYKNKEAFENKPGQTFERVIWRDMQNSYGDVK